MGAKSEVVIRQCPICHQRAEIKITVKGNKRKGFTETWKHVGTRHKKSYRTS
ncbi:MAG: hypothetical protein JRI53_08110 [Deltaproteobacteria bacterium]|nr:hypothetical protein [Deltaproteobacteria bacterium]